MDKLDYRIGLNRNSSNQYYLYKMCDALINNQRFNFPEKNTKVLFCSNLGGSEIVTFLNLLNNEANVKFDNNFQFTAPLDQIFIKWEVVLNSDPKVLDYKNQNDINFIQNAIKNTYQGLVNLKMAKEKYIPMIKDEKMIESIQEDLEQLKILSHNLFNKDNI